MIELKHTEQLVVDQQATGAAIREFRKKLGFSQYQLAEAVKCTKANISFLECGKGNITEKKLNAINKALDKLVTKKLRDEAEALAQSSSLVRRVGFVEGYVLAKKEELVK